MNKLIDKINKKENTIMVVCILIIAACVVFFFYIFSKQIEKKNTFIYSDNLTEKVITISSKEDSTQTITLDEFSYYVIVAEANTQSQALFFREETPVNYWELKTAPLENMRALTKDFCVETCVKDNILYMEALQNNISLTDEEKEYLEDVSYEIYTSLTGAQVNATSIELDDIHTAQEKIFLAEKYILSLVDAKTVENKNELSCDGTYYLEEIKTQYNIEENDELLDDLVFGSITVNTGKE